MPLKPVGGQYGVGHGVTSQWAECALTEGEGMGGRTPPTKMCISRGKRAFEIEFTLPNIFTLNTNEDILG